MKIININYQINAKKNFISLDFLRGLSGYGVAVTHFFAFIYKIQLFEYLSYLFVEFFFVLSGFVLCPQLLKILKKRKNLFIFYKRRWIRTLPLYFLFLFLISLLFNNIGTYDFFKYLFFVQDLFPNFLSINYYPIVWSLSVEEFFYIIFPIFLIFLKRNITIKKLIIFFLIIYFFKILFYQIFDLEFIRKSTLFRFDAIFLGFLLRFVYKNINYNFNFIILFISLFIFVFSKDLVLIERQSFFIKTSFIIILQLISSSLLIFLIKSESFFKKKYLRSICKTISRQTYSIYLSHMIFIYLLFEKNLNPTSNFFIFLFLIFASSYFIYYKIEKPLLIKRPNYL